MSIAIVRVRRDEHGHAVAITWKGQDILQLNPGTVINEATAEIIACAISVRDIPLILRAIEECW